MGKLLIAAVCLLFIQAASSAQEPAADPIAAKITAAKDAFYAERDKAERALISLLEKKEAAAKQAGDLRTIEMVRAELEAFRKEGTLPKSVPLTAYETAMKPARTKLENIVVAAIKNYTQQDKLEEAKTAQSMLEKLLPVQVNPNDPFQKNSAWKNARTGHHLTVTDRTGENFRATFGGNSSSRVIIGTVQGNQVVWLRKDANQNPGNAGGDYYGTITPDAKGGYKMVVNFIEKSGKKDSITIQLQPK